MKIASLALSLALVIASHGCGVKNPAEQQCVHKDAHGNCTVVAPGGGYAVSQR